MSKDKIEVNMNIYDIPIVVEQLEKANKEIGRLSKNNTILENKLNMIKENIETIDKKTIIEIIDNYTGFWGSDKE